MPRRLARTALAAGLAAAHGDVTPQAVDTEDLPTLGDQWPAEHPHRQSDKAVTLGMSASNQNCACCHGLELWALAWASGLAGALAKALEAKPTLLPFNADENMNGDLRNLVRCGHDPGFSLADLGDQKIAVPGQSPAGRPAGC